MEEYIVEMNHVTKRFPGIVANDDVTLKIKKGEVFALLGENGAGKSTIMSALFGMYPIDEGEIIIKGEKVNFESPNDATDHGIGMVHQHFKLVSNYTVAQNIVLGKEPMKKILGVLPYVDMKKAEAEVAALSKKYGLEVNPKDKIEDIPVCTRQRVEILKMLYRDAEILIFDEPTGVLTPQEIEFLLDIIRGLRDSGKTIILITHKIEEIKQIADRCAILRRGKLISVLDVNSASSQEMADMMVGRAVNFNADKKKAKFGEKVLDVEHLTVLNRDKFPVVKDVSFSVRGGEIFAIAGVSGNGQTEIADAVAGMVEAHEGKITFNGKDITKASVRERLDDGMAYIPEDRQGTGLYLDMPLKENLGIRRYNKKPFSQKGILNHAEFNEYADELIKKYDIRSALGGETMARSMSGGNQQKAIVGREMEEHAKLSIFVQPTRGMDIGAIENIHNMILAERDRGAAVLLISLELDEIMKLADTIGCIFAGEMLKIEDASKMTSHDVGKYMMGVKEA